MIEIKPSSTLTWHSADTPFALAVIYASPAFFPVTFPPFTVAIVASEVVHVTFLFTPIIVGTSFMELPIPFVLNCISSRLSESALSFTVTLQTVDFPFAVAVIFAVPAETEVTFPSLSTVATSLLLLFHTVSLFAPFTVAFNCIVFPLDTAFELSKAGAQYRTVVVLFNLILGSTTVTTHVIRGKPMPDEIIAFPFLSAVTTPFSPSCSTVATFSFQETHLVFLPSGRLLIQSTNGFSSSPIFTVHLELLIEILFSAKAGIPPAKSINMNVRINTVIDLCTFFFICIFLS